MPLTEHRALSEAELAAGIVLLDPVMFRLYFFSDELSLPPTKEQKLMYCDQSRRVLLCTARKTSKTIHLEAAVLQKGIWHRSDGITEALFCTPRDVHLNPFIDRVFGRVDKTPFLKSLVRAQRRGDNPILEFAGGLRWYFRIEGLSGSDANMVGIRAKYIMLDEGAFGNHICHNSRLQTALPDAEWIYAGVPNGIRSTPFYALDQSAEGYGWSRHKYPTFINPLYASEGARQQLVDDYGGLETQGYKTQVLGGWGEEMISSYPPGSVAIKPSLPYYTKEIIGLRPEMDMGNIALMVGIPSTRCEQFALGWDYGFSPDPSVIMGAYRRGDKDEWNHYFRITMRRVPISHQAEIVRYLLSTVMVGNFIGLSCDNLIAVQEMQAGDPVRAHHYLWANPGASSPVPDDKGEMVNVPNKMIYVSYLKSWMINAAVDLDGRRLWLGNDRDVTDELVSMSERKASHGRTVYIGMSDPDRKGAILDHNHDALTYLCHAIAEGLKEEVGLNEAELLAAMGWVPTGNTSWRPPYEHN